MVKVFTSLGCASIPTKLNKPIKTRPLFGFQWVIYINKWLRKTPILDHMRRHYPLDLNTRRCYQAIEITRNRSIKKETHERYLLTSLSETFYKNESLRRILPRCSVWHPYRALHNIAVRSDKPGKK